MLVLVFCFIKNYNVDITRMYIQKSKGLIQFNSKYDIIKLKGCFALWNKFSLFNVIDLCVLY